MTTSQKPTAPNREGDYEYALEADPGQCTASFPTWGTLDEALIAATAPVMSKAGLAPVRVLQRRRGPWTAVEDSQSSFSTVECVVVTCACCGVKAFDDDKSEWAGVIHFDSREKAVENITSRDLDIPWQVYDDLAYCGDCLMSMRCFLDGHEWERWRDHVSDRYIGRVRYCDRCGKRDWDPALPALGDKP